MSGEHPYQPAAAWVPAPKRIRHEYESALIERNRRALMVAHAHDWDMETISEAAHVCARAQADSFFGPAEPSPVGGRGGE